MLTGCNFDNYKAFITGNLELRPLTILLGANGVGKTSLLQIPQLMQQTQSASASRYKSALKLHGRNVSIGDAESLFHERATEEPLSFRFTIVDEVFRKELASRLVDDFKASFSTLYSYLSYLRRRRPEGQERRPVPLQLTGPLFLNRSLRDSKPILDEISSLHDSLLPDEKRALLPWDSSKRPR